MEQLRVQLELEFDQKCRERERVVTEQQEQLISGLCEARDEARIMSVVERNMCNKL